MKRSARGDALVDRWSSDAGQALVVEVFRRLQAGRALDDLPIGWHEGRCDLRGICRPRGLPAGDGWRPALTDIGEEPKLRRMSPPELGAVVIENLDLSDAELSSWRWMRTTVLNCRFDGADIEDLGTWATRVEDTSFVGTRGQPRCLGAWDENECGVFRRVDFSGADLRGIGAVGSDFLDCDFSNAKLHKCEWTETDFVRCRFQGLLRENIWHDRAWPPRKATPARMEDVDCSHAELRWCEFRRIDLARVKLPEDDKHLVVRGDHRRFLMRTLEEMKATHDVRYGGYSGAIESDLHWLHPDCRVGVFNLKDLAESDHGTGAILGLMRRVAAEVGATTNL